MMETKTRTDVWVRWDWYWGALFYFCIAVSVVALILANDGNLIDIWLPLSLSLFMALWHGVGLRLAYGTVDSWDERPYLRFIIIMGDIFLWFILVSMSPFFYFVLFGMFGQTFRHLPTPYAIVATILLTFAIFYTQIADTDEAISITSPLVWVYLFMAVAGIVLGIWISKVIEQSTRRRQLIEQLEEAQAELAAAERREGVLEERQRLAREIHDTLAQGFTSIVMHLEAAEQALPEDLDTLEKHIDRARTTARLSLDQARRVVQALRPDLLEKQSLSEAIERVAVRWTDESGIPVSVNTTGEATSLHPDIEVTFLRATQEALNNIRKYAQAHEVSVTLSYMTDLVILDVQDDGIGLGAAKPSPLSGGFGLQAMKERAAEFGGSVIVESEPDEGTTLVVSIPIERVQVGV